MVVWTPAPKVVGTKINLETRFRQPSSVIWDSEFRFLPEVFWYPIHFSKKNKRTRKTIWY